MMTEEEYLREDVARLQQALSDMTAQRDRLKKALDKLIVLVALNGRPRDFFAYKNISSTDSDMNEIHWRDWLSLSKTDLNGKAGG